MFVRPCAQCHMQEKWDKTDFKIEKHTTISKRPEAILLSLLHIIKDITEGEGPNIWDTWRRPLPAECTLTELCTESCQALTSQGSWWSQGQRGDMLTYLVGAHVYLCADASYICVYVWICTWRPEINIGFHSSGVTHQFFMKQSLLLGLRAHWLG